MKNELLDYDTAKFKKFGGEVIDDVAEYIKNYIKDRSNIRIVVGCDSQQKRRITLYAITIVLYDEVKHKGAHVLFLRQKLKKNKDMFSRLMNECLFSLNLAEWLNEKLKYSYTPPKFEVNSYDGNLPTKKIEVHVDVNPIAGRNKQNKSNIVYNSVMGMVSGMGYKVVSKPYAYAASCAADLLVK